MILNDTEIAWRCNEPKPMISPFIPEQRKAPYGANDRTRSMVSFGLSSFGYDMRLDTEMLLCDPTGPALDVKAQTQDSWEQMPVRKDQYGALYVIMPPHSFVLGRSVERWRIPRDIMCVVYGKSSYARVGIIVNVTPMEPEWEGHLTIELSNTAPLPNRVYANEGIAQALFFMGQPPMTSYADRKGKYQAQVAVTLAKV